MNIDMFSSYNRTQWELKCISQDINFCKKTYPKKDMFFYAQFPHPLTIKTITANKKTL